MSARKEKFEECFKIHYFEAKPPKDPKNSFLLSTSVISDSQELQAMPFVAIIGINDSLRSVVVLLDNLEGDLYLGTQLVSSHNVLNLT